MDIKPDVEKRSYLEMSIFDMISDIYDSRILLIQNAPEKIPMSHASPPARMVRRERSMRGQVVANIEPPPPPAVYHEEVT